MSCLCCCFFFSHWRAPDLSVHGDATNSCRICCSFTLPSRFFFFYLEGPKLKRLAWSWTPSYVKFPFNVLLVVVFFFQMPPLGRLRSNPNAPALFFASATPSRPVKIDSLASSTRQLWAICSRLGSSSSFCFCDCSYNVICSELELEKSSRGGRGFNLTTLTVLLLPVKIWESEVCIQNLERLNPFICPSRHILGIFFEITARPISLPNQHCLSVVSNNSFCMTPLALGIIFVCLVASLFTVKDIRQ